MKRAPFILELVWGTHFLLLAMCPKNVQYRFWVKVNFPCLYSCKVSPYPPLCAIAWASVCTTRSQRLVSPLLLAHNPSGVARSAIAHAYIHAPHPHHARAQRSCVVSIQRSRRAVKTRYSWPICHVCTVQFIKFSESMYNVQNIQNALKM